MNLFNLRPFSGSWFKMTCSSFKGGSHFERVQSNIWSDLRWNCWLHRSVVRHDERNFASSWFLSFWFHIFVCWKFLLCWICFSLFDDSQLICIQISNVFVFPLSKRRAQQHHIYFSFWRIWTSFVMKLLSSSVMIWTWSVLGSVLLYLPFLWSADYAHYELFYVKQDVLSLNICVFCKDDCSSTPSESRVLEIWPSCSCDVSSRFCDSSWSFHYFHWVCLK